MVHGPMPIPTCKSSAHLHSVSEPSRYAVNRPADDESYGRPEGHPSIHSLSKYIRGDSWDHLLFPLCDFASPKG